MASDKESGGARTGAVEGVGVGTSLTGAAAVVSGASAGGTAVVAAGNGVEVAEVPQAAETSSTSAAATTLAMINRFPSIKSRNPNVATGQFYSQCHTSMRTIY